MRVRAVGICGTDLEICHGTMGYYTQGCSPPPHSPTAMFFFRKVSKERLKVWMRFDVHSKQRTTTLSLT